MGAIQRLRYLQFGRAIVQRFLLGLGVILFVALIALGGTQAKFFFLRGTQGPIPPPRFTSMTMTCGASCSFTSGTAGSIGTATATLSSGSVTGTWGLKTSGTDSLGTTCVNYGTDFTIVSTTGAISNSAGAPVQSYPGVCPQITQGGIVNSPFSTAFTFTGNSSGSCVNSGSNLCSLLGSYGPDLGASSWMTRYWDFTDGGIGQNQCTFYLNNSNYPVNQGGDNPGQIGSYQTTISADSGCVPIVYGIKLQNEWSDGCPSTNPWYVSPGNCLDESQTPTTSIATWKANVCAMVSYAKNIYPNAKIELYGPHNDVEAQFIPSDSDCHFDLIGLHIYLYGDQQPGRTGKGDWASGTPYSCGITPNNTLPHDVQCSPTSREGYAVSYANSRGKPLSISEWCSAYGDTASPNGGDYGTWVIANWIKTYNIATSQHWSGDPDGQGKSDCSISNNSLVSSANLELEMRLAFGGTHYAGSFYAYKNLPVPNQYP